MIQFQKKMNPSLPPTSGRCSATTAAGGACKNNAASGSDNCRVHAAPLPGVVYVLENDDEAAELAEAIDALERDDLDEAVERRWTARGAP